MNIDKKYKLELVASKDKTREVLNSIYVYQNGTTRAIATNGKTLASVPVTIEEGELSKGNSVKADDFKFQRTNPALKKLDNMFVALEPLSGQYPDIDSVIPKHPAIYSISLDVTLLSDLCRALGTDNVQLDIVDDKTIIKVTPYNTENKAFGLICPLR